MFPLRIANGDSSVTGLLGELFIETTSLRRPSVRSREVSASPTARIAKVIENWTMLARLPTEVRKAVLAR